MNFSRFSALAICSIVISSHASADVQRDVFNNMAHEMIECSAYFYVVSTALHNSNNKQVADQYEKVADNALEKAMIITKEASMLPATVSARLDTALQGMIKQINSDTANISILSRQYMTLCEEVMNDTNARGQYWLNKAISKERQQ